MTDTEAKALALVNDVCGATYDYLAEAAIPHLEDALCRAIERLEATEARHAAELRELKERFSEAASLTLRMLTPYPLARDEAEDILIPFILPAPDPLVEAIRDMALTDATQEDADRLRAALLTEIRELRAENARLKEELTDTKFFIVHRNVSDSKRKDGLDKIRAALGEPQ